MDRKLSKLYFIGIERALLILMFLLALVLPLILSAQEADTSLLNLKRLITNREFSGERFGPARWLGDGSGYTTLEKSENGVGKDIVRYDCESGERTVLVHAAKLIPDGEDQPLKISNYHWSDDGNRLLIFTNTRRVWRRNTRGDYWMIDMNNWHKVKLGADTKPSTLMFATFSPNGEKVAYVKDNNLYIEALESHSVTALTSSGSKSIINGTFDWVYEEEFGLRNGLRWSPNSKRIAYWQLDAEGVGVFNMINNIDSIYSKIIPVQYPKVGTTNSACRVGIVELENGETTWLKVVGDPRNFYIARMDWAASSDEVIIQQLNRLQNTNRVMLGDAESGEVHTVFTDNDEAWVNVVDDLKWINDGREFTWISERDGWNHAYRISRSGDQVQVVTPGEYDITRIVGIDDKNDWLYLMASPENPTQRYLFRSRLDGKGKPERLTPAHLSGTHRYDISPNFKWAIHTYSSIDNPPVIELVHLPEHETVRILVDNKDLRDKLSPIKRKPTEFFRVDIGDGVKLDGYRILPYNFDPSKKYPVLFYVYGEPAGQTVRDAWGGSNYLWHTMLAQQGYVVISIDNRGTPAPRGRKWRKSIYRQIGILASADQAAACRIIRTWDFVDSTRIGIWGWSGGGSMSLNAIFRYPDLYQTAMAIAFISDQRLYDTVYQERYMGLPDDNEDGYANGSPITFAKQLEGNLLLIHGTADDNCHYQSAEMLIDELIKQNKMFTVVPYPGRSHGIYERKNTRRHLFETLTWYLKIHLPPGPLE